MEEQKFKEGDICTIRTTGETVVVLKYKINYAGGLVNQSLGIKKYPDSAVTDEVLCEGRIDGKFQKKYINEISLELKGKS